VPILIAREGKSKGKRLLLQFLSACLRPLIRRDFLLSREMLASKVVR